MKKKKFDLKAVHFKNEAQKEYFETILNNEVTFCTGPAGTAKTFIAIYAALCVYREKNIRKIVICRPTVEAGERLGFLPGGYEEKVDPYLRPIRDCVKKLTNVESINKDMEVLPLAYMRGVTLDNCFAIMDEGQNATLEQIKMFLTRLGKGSKMVINGDVSQIDLPKSQSGLLNIHNERDRFNIGGVGFFEFSGEDIVRNKLIAKLLDVLTWV